MVRAPETHYAQRPDGVNIGYQALGDGPLTLIWCWGWVSHLDLQWTDPGIAGFFERLAAFCRLVIYDKAGTGVSDPVGPRSSASPKGRRPPRCSPRRTPSGRRR
jgi:hypothetical protein